jgi:hypothetical protein
MEVLYERCFGIDIHKSSVAASILLEQKHKPLAEVREAGDRRCFCERYPASLFKCLRFS